MGTILDGLSVSRDQFSLLPRKQKDLVIFDNVTYIKKNLENYRFHKKIQYIWLFLLTSVIITILGLKKYISI